VTGTVRAGLTAALAAALVGGAACSGSAAEVEASIRLVVRDKNIRTEGVECAGARPFHYVHAGAPFTIEAGDGSVVAEGTLPAGRAENAEPGVDWGVDRIPTFCVVELEVDLPERPRYRLRLERGRPLEFVPEEGEPVVLLVG
jgi:hypothetical protein